MKSATDAKLITLTLEPVDANHATAMSEDHLTIRHHVIRIRVSVCAKRMSKVVDAASADPASLILMSKTSSDVHRASAMDIRLSVRVQWATRRSQPHPISTSNPNAGSQLTNLIGQSM